MEARIFPIEWVEPERRKLRLLQDVTVDKSKDHPAFVEMEWPVPDPPIEGELTIEDLVAWANRTMAEGNPTRQRVTIVGVGVRISKPGKGPLSGYDVDS